MLAEAVHLYLGNLLLVHFERQVHIINNICRFDRVQIQSRIWLDILNNNFR